jgi:hypothetical protein
MFGRIVFVLVSGTPSQRPIVAANWSTEIPGTSLPCPMSAVVP